MVRTAAAGKVNTHAAPDFSAGADAYAAGTDPGTHSAASASTAIGGAAGISQRGGQQGLGKRQPVQKARGKSAWEFS